MHVCFYYACVHVSVDAFVCVCVRVCVLLRLCMCLRMCVYARACACVYVCKFVVTRNNKIPRLVRALPYRPRVRRNRVHIVSVAPGESMW